ncbi:MAG: helix-turn-helix domain-containing protein [Gordonibacter sp.]
MTSFASTEELGGLLREERKRKGYTQLKLAHYSGVGVNFISNLERGKETSELGKALRVAQTLGIDLSADSRAEQWIPSPQRECGKLKQEAPRITEKSHGLLPCVNRTQCLRDR